MRRSTSKPMDALVILARASAGRRKRQTLVALLVIAAVVLVVGALLVWWMWPSGSASPVGLALFDQVAQPDERVSLVARLQSTESQNLAGCAIHLEEARSGLRQQAVTQRNGVATVEASFPAGDSPLTVAAGYPGDPRRKRRGVQAYGRVFVWPADRPVLVVDTESSLPDTEAETFWSANNLDIRPRAGAREALLGVQAKYRLAYLTAEGAAPVRYNKVRAWLESSYAPARQFPDGPVLTAGQLDGASPPAVRQAVLSDLKQRFPGSLHAVTGDAAVARSFHELGVTTYLLGREGEVPGGVTRVEAWSDLAKRLPP
jgi:hypothetical protein